MTSFHKAQPFAIPSGYVCTMLRAIYDMVYFKRAFIRERKLGGHSIPSSYFSGRGLLEVFIREWVLTCIGSFTIFSMFTSEATVYVILQIFFFSFSNVSWTQFNF